ncbi:MAG: N-acetylmuramoyl-L-alanine amidase, partial [Bdellovibrionales bacterium]|nr:N-acetylmuramoyl-L-alanine amidase [Bdellovibrionales bacterium]
MKLFLGKSCSWLAILLFVLPLNAKRPLIVIDPGHGGIDSGASVQAHKESAMALETALALKLFLESNSAFEVQLTREEDHTTSLDRRVQMANSKNANLFLSLHLNSNDETSAQGTEFYIMGSMDMDEETLFLAHQENRVRDTQEDQSSAADEAGATETTPTDLNAILRDLKKMNETEQSYLWARTLRNHCRTEFPGRACKMRQA